MSAQAGESVLGVHITLQLSPEPKPVRSPEDDLQNRVNFDFVKIKSFRHLQIAQHTTATPTQMTLLIFLDWLDSQELNIWLIDLSGVKPVE